MNWILINDSKPNNTSKVVLTCWKTIDSNQKPVPFVVKALYSKSLDLFLDLKEVESDRVIGTATTYEPIAWQPQINRFWQNLEQLKPYNSTPLKESS